MINTLLDNAADFLILLKMKSDNLIQEQANIKQFLEFLTVKAKTIEENHKIAALRAFYYSLFQDRNLNLALAIDVNLANNLPLPLALDLALARMEAVCKQILEQFSVKTMLDLIQAFDLQRKYVLAGEFAECLEQLKNQLTSLCLDKKTLENWWKQEGLVWYRDLQNAITKHRYLGYSWQFSCEEQEVLAQYYQANQFILECLQSSCIVDPSVAQKIEDSLLNFDWFSQEILEKNYKS